MMDLSIPLLAFYRKPCAQQQRIRAAQFIITIDLVCDGNFVGNFVETTDNVAYGGALYNEGIIESITGDLSITL